MNVDLFDKTLKMKHGWKLSRVPKLMSKETKEKVNLLELPDLNQV